MTQYYCFSDAAGGGNGTVGSPWNDLATALASLKTTYASVGAAGGHVLNLRGVFSNMYSVDSLSGTSGNLFTIRTDPGAPSLARIDGNYAYPTQQNALVFNWYKNSAGGLAGYGLGGLYYNGLLRCIGSTAYVKFEGLIVENSRSLGISGLINAEVVGCTIRRCLLNPVKGDSYNVRQCVFHDYSQINYRGAQSVVYPIVGGTQFAGDNGSATANKSKTTLVLTTNRVVEDSVFYNTGGEAVNVWSADGVIVRNCTFYNHFSVGLYLHNVKNVLAENNVFYYDPSTWYFDFPQYTVMSAADLVYPGFPTSIFSWTSIPAGGGTALADPHLSGGGHHNGASLCVGGEFPQVQFGENVHIRNNVFYKGGLREYNVTGGGPYAVSWSTATNQRQTGLRIEHNTFVEAPEYAGLSLNPGIAHPGAIIKNNVVDQLPTSVAPRWSPSEITTGGNVWKLNPGSSYLGATDVVGDPKLTKGSTVNRAWFLPLTGSAAINRGVTIADITADAAGHARDSTPTAGALEYLLSAPEEESPVPDTSRLRVNRWLIYLEGDDTTTDLVIPEIEFAATIGGAALTASKTVTASSVVSNVASAFDGDVGTNATATGAAVIIVAFTDAQAVEEVRVKYPASTTPGSTGPVRIAISAEHPVTGREIPMAERVNITPSASGTVALSVNTRIGQVRALRRRAISAMRAARV